MPRPDKPRKFEIGKTLYILAFVGLGALLVWFFLEPKHPCKNLHKYACEDTQGDQILRTFFPTIPKQRRLDIMKEMLEANASVNDSNAFNMTRRVYNTCLELGANESRKDEYKNQVADLLRTNATWPLTGEPATGEFNLQSALVNARKEMGLDIFFHVSNDSDGLRLERHSYRTYDQAAEQESVKKWPFNTAGGTVNKELLNSTLGHVLSLHETLANISQGNMTNMTIREMQTRLPLRNITWLAMLEQLYGEMRKFYEDSTVKVDFDYFKQLVQVINDANASTLANYIRWKTGERIVDKFSLNDDDEMAAHCLKMVSDNGLLLLPLQKQFARNNLNDESRAAIKDMIADITRAFLAAIDETTWLDAEAKESARSKIGHVVANGPHSAWFNDDPAFDALYSKLAPSDSHFENVRNVLRSTAGNKLAKIVNERAKWFMGAYDAKLNAFAISPLFVRPPWHNATQSAAQNFGGLGVLVAREMARALTPDGATYDAFANRRPLFAPNTSMATKWAELADNLRNQYSKYTFSTSRDSGTVNGARTLEMNFADNVALDLALRAYKNQVPDDDVMVDELRINSDQLFFISFAKTLCRQDNGDYEPDRSPYAPNEWRVNGAVSNSRKFATTFKCASNARMNPSGKIVVWGQ